MYWLPEDGDCLTVVIICCYVTGRLPVLLLKRDNCYRVLDNECKHILNITVSITSLKSVSVHV
jgi:hypothetical protein